MSTVRNLSAGDVVPQMGFAPTQNQNGGWSATRSYYMLAETWEGAATQTRFARGTAISTADPSVDSVYSFLAVESKTASYEDCGTIILTVNYTGSASAQFGGEDQGDLSLEAQPTYRLEGRLRELSLAEHPKFKALPDDQRRNLNLALDGTYKISRDGLELLVPSSNDGKFIPVIGLEFGQPLTIDAGDAQEFALLINDGQITYEAPSLVWIETTQGQTGMTPQQLGKLGEISTPRGNPPTVPGYNWMLTSASQQQSGMLYQTTLEWTLSTPSGYNQFLYTST